jgi:hypothetical protein
MNNIFKYVTRDEATEEKLISGINCSPDTAMQEFNYVKQKFDKTDGRTYYHIVQPFSPEDNISAKTAHEIGLKFAEYFPEFQVLAATHYNTKHIHNHLIMNSLNFKNGKKFHQTRDELLEVKAYSNKICKEYGLSITEEKCRYKKWAEWKKLLRSYALYAMRNSETKEDFIQIMREHGYKVKWEDKYKYITFTTPDNHICRDKSLFDERLLKDDMEIYFALGGTNSELADEYFSYQTPYHDEKASMTITTGLMSLLGDLLSSLPSDNIYTPRPVKELSPYEKLRLEKILGKKIEPKAFACYSTQEEYEQAVGLTMVW